MTYDFSPLTKRLQALNNSLQSQIINFSGIDEKGMRLEYYNNSYVNVEDMDFLQNNVLYITGLPASGKSELAEKLSKEYDIPVISLDEIANGNFDTQSKVFKNYLCSPQSERFEQYSDNEAENFLYWLRTETSPERVIVEGYQIYDIQYKSRGKIYNSMLENKRISIIILNPSLQTVVQNRITRDCVSREFAEHETEKEFQKLKTAFHSHVKTTENL